MTDVSTFNWDENESFTIELWMKSGEKGAISPDGTNRNAVLMGREDAGGNLLWYVGTNSGSGKAIFWVKDGGGDLYSTNNIADNVWHHVVCVRDADNNKITIYVDGAFQSERAVTNADLDGGTSAVNFGHLNWPITSNPDTTFEYNGLLDEISVYSGALSEAQIRQHYRKVEQFIITTEPVIFARLGGSYTYDVNSSDEANTDYFLDVSPNGMVIDSDSGLITWTPDTVGTGLIPVRIVASNGIYDITQSYVFYQRPHLI